MADTPTTDTDHAAPTEHPGPIARSHTFMSGVIHELHKVVWPNRHQLWTASAVVLIVVVAVAVFLWGVDEVMAPLTSWLTP